MPIKNVPIIHRFGIISHSQRLELQERLARKVLEEGTKKTVVIERKDHYSIDQEFVDKFNQAQNDSEERFQLEQKAEQIFLRTKRKAGLREGGIGDHVNLSQAWKDLSLLAMCDSRKFQEGALNSLHESLCYAPISKNHVKSLIALADNSLRWLAGSEMDQPYLRTGEMKLLKVTHLVFVRLYYHHLAADIKGLHAERTLLIDMVKAFEEKQDIYRPFPNSLLLARIIIKVGLALRRSLEREFNALVELDERYRKYQKQASFSRNLESTDQIAEGSRGMTSTGHKDEAGMVENQEESQIEDEVFEENNMNVFHKIEPTFDPSDAKENQVDIEIVPEDIHDTAPTLWHSLELWRCATLTNQKTEETVEDLMNCSLDFYNEPVLDCILALHVLAEASKISEKALKLLQLFTNRDVMYSTDTKPTNNSTNNNSNNNGEFQFESQLESESDRRHDATLERIPSVLDSLREFLDPRPTAECEQEGVDKEGIGNIEEMITLKQPDFSDDHTTILSADISRHGSKYSPTMARKSVSDGSLADISSLDSMQSRTDIKTRSSKRRLRRRVRANDDECRVDSDDSEAGTDGKEAASWRRRKEDYLRAESTMSIGLKGTSSHCCTNTRPNTSIEGVTKWPWEVVVTYVKCLGDVCMNGTSSKIQKQALIGGHENEAAAGLVHLIKFQMPFAEDNSDWSWRVRHVAVQELIKISHHNNHNPNREGLQNAAWGILLYHHSIEKDRRVLEAFKIARFRSILVHKCVSTQYPEQPNTELDFDENLDITKPELRSYRKTNLYSRICMNLSIMQLAPLEASSTQLNNAVKGSPRGQGKSRMQRSIASHRSLIDQKMPRGQRSIENNTRARDTLSQPGQDSLRDRLMPLELTGDRALSKESRKQRSFRGRQESPRGQGSGRNIGGQQGNRDPMMIEKKVGRISIRDEILIANAMETKQDKLEHRAWADVTAVVEDQWRKQLYAEYEIIEGRKQEKLDKAILELGTVVDEHL
eukprot:gene5884-6573_t